MTDNAGDRSGTKDEQRDRIAGCLLGGAIGDAVGAGIEFLQLIEIRSRYGPVGVAGYVPAYGRLGAFTDDTQMALFTTEGLIRANVRGRTKGITSFPSVVRHAYMRWLHTQGDRWPPPNPLDIDADSPPDGWLIRVPELHNRRAPGATCLSGLRQSRLGTPDEPINDSKGCGGVMRAAPAGFTSWSDVQRFRLGSEIAALTHGHPSGYLPAGLLACVVGALVDGDDITNALDSAEAVLTTWDGHDETLAALRAGRQLGRHGPPPPEALESLGGGWVGEEALSVAVACAEFAPDFRSGVLAAVNHSGDSDSTGSIAGNLLGAKGGTWALPGELLESLELRGVIETLADDAYRELRGVPPDEDHDEFQIWWDRYPGW